MWLIEQSDGVPMKKMLAGMAGPLVACVPMVGAVMAVRYGLGLTDDHPFVGLTIEVVAGAATYVASALVLARAASADFLGLLRKSFRPPPEPDA
jgi:PST family polysaccharide transporter